MNAFRVAEMLAMNRTNTQLSHQLPNRHLPKSGQCGQVFKPTNGQLLALFNQLKQFVVFRLKKFLLLAFLVEGSQPLNLRYRKPFVYLLQQLGFLGLWICPASPQGNYISDERIQRTIV